VCVRVLSFTAKEDTGTEEYGVSCKLSFLSDNGL
jgi:hypothetical protein